MMVDIEIIKEIAIGASQKIMEVYASDNFDVQTKEDDSPVTRADSLSNEWIIAHLQKAYPKIPIVSEESDEILYETRKKFDSFWLIDPLDGTKDFVKKNGEFTVNIALIQNNRPILGVIHVPVSNILYWGKKGSGSYRHCSKFGKTKLQSASFNMAQKNLSVICSRSNLNDKTKKFIAELNEPKIISIGSSLKFMMLAEGTAEIYPRLSPLMEWDIAAAEIILQEAGGKILQNGNPIMYNQEIMKIHSFTALGNINNIS